MQTTKNNLTYYMLRSILKKAGLNSKEAAIYLALLELGSQPASVIAKKANLNRSTSYLILESLMNKGFVNQHVRAEVKYFTATDPHIISQILEKKVEDAQDVFKDFKGLIPELYAITNPMSVKPRVRFYEGFEGVRQVMEDVFTSEETILSWDSLDSWFDGNAILQKFIVEFGKQRTTKYKIPIRMLVVDTPRTRKYLLKDYPARKKKVDPLMELRWIPKSVNSFRNQVNIYGDKVGIVSLGKNELHGVIIESHEIAQVHKSMFELAWQAGKTK